MQSTHKLYCGFGQVVGKVQIEVHTQQQQGDGVGVCDVNRLNVIVYANCSHRIHNLRYNRKMAF